MDITEFNTSYNPFCPIHDLPVNAAYIASFLSRVGEVADSASYWTFGDVFEEQGVPASPFHGGFGMMADQCIAKPTLWVFKWYCALQGKAVMQSDSAVVTRHEDGTVEAILWNLGHSDTETLRLCLDLPCGQERVMTVETVDEDHGNPAKLWHLLGEPQTLKQKQLDLLREAAHPGVQVRVLAPGQRAEVELEANAVVHLTIREACREGEYGYDYGWYAAHIPVVKE